MSRLHQDGESYGQAPSYRFALPAITPMVKRLVVINLVVYAITLLAYLAHPESRALITRALGLSPADWRGMFPWIPFWQLFTYGFLHEVSPGHVLMNMLLLYFFGTMVEGTLGASRFLCAYLGAMLAGALLFLVVGTLGAQQIPAIGASGAVLGMVVAAACFAPDTRVILIVVPVALKWLAIGIVGLDVINGALSWRSGVDDGVAHLVHIGGAAYGFIAVRTGLVWRDPIQRVRVRRAIAQEEKRQGEEHQMDDLLEKIHREGLNSLSKREREFLKRVSSRR